MSEERETRLLMISPASHITPDQLTRTIHTIGKQVTVKETCYGCLVEGPRETVREIRDEVRKLDPNGIFSKALVARLRSQSSVISLMILKTDTLLRCFLAPTPYLHSLPLGHALK